MQIDNWPLDEGIDDGLPISVVFRRWRDTGDVIALFPFLPASITQGQNECMSYMHVGQHGAAEYQHVIEATDPCDPTKNDCAALYLELQDRGYSLCVMTHEEACAEVGRKIARKEIEDEGI